MLLSSVALLVSLLLLPVISRAVHRSPAAGVYLVSAFLLADLVIDLPFMHVGGFRLDLARDPAGLLLLAIGVYRLLARRRSAATVVAYAFATFFVVAMARGLLEYGLSGRLEFSGTLLLLAGVCYGGSFDLGDDRLRRAIFRALLWTSAAIVLLAPLAWAGIINVSQIASAPAFVVAQSGLLMLVRIVERSPNSVLDYAIAGSLFGIVLLFQQRTVWVVAGLAIAFILVHRARRAPRLLAAMAGVLIIGIAAQSVGFVAARAQFEGPTLAESMQAAASDDQTYEWRRDLWHYTVQTHRERGPLAVLLGAGYGAPWMTFGPLVNRLEGPHNQYIEFFVRYGLVGALAYAWLLTWSARRLWRHRRRGSETGLSDYGLLVLVLMHSVWSVTYWMDSWQPVLLGLVVAAAAGSGAALPSGGVRGLTPVAATHRVPQTAADSHQGAVLESDDGRCRDL